MKTQKQNIEKDQGLHPVAQQVADPHTTGGREKTRGIIEMFHPKHQLIILISMIDIIDVDTILKIDAVQIDIREKDLVTGQEVPIGTRIEVENIFKLF